MANDSTYTFFNSYFEAEYYWSILNYTIKSKHIRVVYFKSSILFETPYIIITYLLLNICYLL